MASISITCYGETKKWKSRAAALKFYKECARNSEGCERDRYINIIFGLEDGLTDISDC